MCTELKKNHKISCKIATVLTDMAPHNQWLVNHEFIDYFFVANKQMKDSLSDLGIAGFKIFVTGIPLSGRFLENFDRESIFKEFNLDSSKTTVLFFAGRRIWFRKKFNIYDFKSSN